jgi:hypothetical protein
MKPELFSKTRVSILKLPSEGAQLFGRTRGPTRGGLEHRHGDVHIRGDGHLLGSFFAPGTQPRLNFLKLRSDFRSTRFEGLSPPGALTVVGVSRE